MFRLLRFFSVTSLFAIVATAALLTWFYRQVAIQGIVRLAERSNTNLAEVALNPMRPEILEFLQLTENRSPGPGMPPLPPQLAQSIAALVHEERFVAKIKIYNPRGTVVYSTHRDEIGDDQSGNDGVRSASAGKAASDLVYRDTFNRFDEETEEDNLVQTYLPVRAPGSERVVGVFELYGDVNMLMHQTERMQFMVIAGAVPILLALYAVLLLIVRHATSIIERQQETIHERNETLALMAARLLRAEESHNKEVAFALQEGVAQTLAALKVKAEHGAPGGAGPESIIPLLQEAIREVRTIATDLRPSSLDDLGLVPTLKAQLREFQQQHAGIAVEEKISVDESQVPAALKGIVHRIAASVLGEISQQVARGTLRLALWREEARLVLGFDLRLAANGSAVEFSRMQELVTLSGGTFTSTPSAENGIVLKGAWSA